MGSTAKPYLREYWAPNLSQILFWAYAVLVGIGAGLAISQSQWLIAGTLLAAIFLVRIWLESILILFEVRDLLKDIRDQSEKTEQSTRINELRKAVQTKPTVGEHRLDPR